MGQIRVGWVWSIVGWVGRIRWSKQGCVSVFGVPREDRQAFAGGGSRARAYILSIFPCAREPVCNGSNRQHVTSRVYRFRDLVHVLDTSGPK